MTMSSVGVDELIAFYDGSTGERAALTAAELGGWSAATAELLLSECGLAPGSEVAVLLPAHWQTAAVLLGAWFAGLKVSIRGWATAGLSPAGPQLDASFVEKRRIGNWLDDVPDATHRFVLGLAPAAAPASPIPEGYRDYPTAVRPHLGAAPAPVLAPADQAATTDGTTFGAYGALAAELAARQGYTGDSRVLVDAATHEQPLMWLLAPLVAGATVVICRDLPPARRDAVIAAEQITHALP